MNAGFLEVKRASFKAKKTLEIVIDYWKEWKEDKEPLKKSTTDYCARDLNSDGKEGL